MAGIVRAGVSIPRYRLSGEVLKRAWGRGGAGERAVANHDEDALTLAVEASSRALAGLDRSKIDAVFFASTTPTYLERENAGLLAAACDLKEEVFTADLTGSLRAGSEALRGALDAVASGSAQAALVAAADLRTMEPESPGEGTAGDAGVAFVVGKEGMAAEVVAHAAVASAAQDVWRQEGHPYPSEAEARFAQDLVYLKLVPKAVEQVLKKAGFSREKIARAALYAPDGKSFQALARTLKLPEGSLVQGDLFGSVGSPGVACLPLGLVRALEEARPGERVLSAGFGSGSDALLFEVKRPLEPSVGAQVARKRPLESYEKYLKFRKILPSERVDPFTSPAVLWREERELLRLKARRCRGCKSIQYPPRRICWKCSKQDDMEEVPLGREGTIFTYTKDHLPPTPDPPVLMASADLEGGGRFYGQVTDCAPSEIRIGGRVELTFRKLHEGGGFVNYFWKMRPVG